MKTEEVSRKVGRGWVSKTKVASRTIFNSRVDARKDLMLLIEFCCTLCGEKLVAELDQNASRLNELNFLSHWADGHKNTFFGQFETRRK